MLIKWFPRSWLQIKSQGQVVYFDPSYMSTYFKKCQKKVIFSDNEDDCLPENLEKADLILISHTHKDHCKEITISRLSSENTIILTPQKYKDNDDSNVKIIETGCNYSFQNISVETVNAYNTASGSSVRKVHKKGKCTGYIINIEGKRVYFSGDTDFISEMKDLSDIDIAILPIGGVFTMDMEEAADAVLAIKPRCVIPVHNLKNDPGQFKEILEKKWDITALIPQMGEEYEF